MLENGLMKRTMLLAAGVFVVAALAMGTMAGAAGEDEQDAGSSTEAKAILKKSAAALEKVKLVQYQGKYEGTGWVKQFVADVEGRAALGAPSEYDVPRFRCEVKLTPPNAEETSEFTAGADGDLYYLVDPEKKIVYADMDDAVMGSQQRNLQRVLLPDFVAEKPLEADLGAENVQLAETVDVGGEACHQVRVIQSEEREVIWFISTKDYLPRRVDRVYRNPERGEGVTRLVISDLKASATPEDKPFRLEVPAGYSRTDDFAP
jgi:hypothetical protein